MVITQHFRMFLAGSCSPEMIDYKSFTVSKQPKEKGMNSDMFSIATRLYNFKWKMCENIKCG